MARSLSCLIGLVLAVLLFFAPASATEGNGTVAHGGSADASWAVSVLSGYQHIGLNFSAPYVSGPFIVELADPAHLDLRLHNADMWVNGIDGEFRKGRFSGFLGFKGAAPRQTDVKTGSEPFYAGAFPVQWHADTLNWWSIDAGAGMDISAHFTVQAGLRIERLSLALRNPGDPTGTIESFHNIYGDSYNGNLRSNLLIPWVGVQVRASRFDGSLRFSPIANTDLKIPLTYNFIDAPTIMAIENAQYRFRNNGFWLEGNFAYDLYRTQRWKFSFWSTASWLWTRGGTNYDFDSTLYRQGFPPTVLRADSSYVRGTYILGNYGAGLRLGYAF